MLNKSKVKKVFFKVAMLIVVTLSFLINWECFWVWLVNDSYYYDWVEPSAEGYMSYDGFWIYDELKSSGNKFFYYVGWSSWTWDVSFIYNNGYYSKIWTKFTNKGYIWYLSWYSYADSIWLVRMSLNTTNVNSQYANHFWNADISWTEQNENNYWVWIDRRWDFSWKWKIESEPFYSGNYNLWSTKWRPMPFDRDWDSVNNNNEASLVNWKSWEDTDGDWTLSWENDWDSDWDWWNDWEESCFWSSLIDASSMPPDSDADWLYNDFENKMSWCSWDQTWPNWDCDWDWLTNKEEQQFCSDPMDIDSDDDWLNDFQEFITWKNPNNLSDWCIEPQIDTDKDWISDCKEILWVSYSYIYYNESCEPITINRTNIVLDMYNPDSDFDNINDGLDFDPDNWDIDWDITPDKIDQNPLSYGWCNTDDTLIDDLDWDGLPNWWEELYTNWANNWVETPWIISQWEWKCESVLIPTSSNPTSSYYILNKENPDSDDDEYWDWDEDFDKDGLTNYEEYLYWTNPNNWDTDGDCMADWVEQKYVCLSPDNLFDANSDSDWDWLLSIDEVNWIEISIVLSDGCLGWSYKKIIILDPCSKDFDTDDDWLNDKFEIDNWLDPSNPDTDWDWVLDWIEISLIWIVADWELVSNPLDCNITPIDTDLDWLVDVFENMYTNWGEDWLVYRETFTIDWSVSEFSLIYDDMDKDSDNDWILDPDEDFDLDKLSNIDEQKYWTDPNNWDSDWDWISDKDEIINWLNPNNWVDWRWDYDWDWLWNYEEIFWYVISTSIYNWNTLIKTETWLYKTSPFDSDSDDDWINDFREVVLWLNSSFNDTDWDWVYDWAELTMWSNPRNLVFDLKTSDKDWWNKDYLPDIWETTFSNWGKTVGKIIRLNNLWIWEEITASWDNYKLDISKFNTNSDSKPDYEEDFDWDWLNNREELINWTDPNNWDTDWDLISDSKEAVNWFSSFNKIDWNQDYDWDWISNLEELNWINITIQITWDSSCATWYTTKVFLDSWMRDTDKDGLSDKYEIDNSLDPSKADTDWDWINDGIEISLQRIDWNLWDSISADPLNCSTDINLIDQDNDDIYDIFEDFYTNWWPLWIVKRESGTIVWPSLTADFTLSKLVPGVWSLSNRNDDFDKDWLSNYEEMLNWTDPNDWDSDWDLISDWEEVKMLLDPNSFLNKNQDSDWDYITDAIEIKQYKTDPLKIDTDNDWLNDKIEIELWLDPLNLDSDWDKIPDWIEYTMFLINESYWNPLSWSVVINDLDQDLLPDEWEVRYKMWWNSGIAGNIVSEAWNIPVTTAHNLVPISSTTVAGSNEKLDSLKDFDLDWYVNLEELYFWTNPNNWDSDWDWISDTNDPFPNEKCNFDPYCLNWSRAFSDKDQDWISDLDEINWWTYATNWTLYDTDWDSLSDWYERDNSLDPLKKDTSWDAINDWFETYIGKIWVAPAWSEGVSFLEGAWGTLLESYITKLLELFND